MMFTGLHLFKRLKPVESVKCLNLRKSLKSSSRVTYLTCHSYCCQSTFFSGKNLFFIQVLSFPKPFTWKINLVTYIHDAFKVYSYDSKQKAFSPSTYIGYMYNFVHLKYSQYKNDASQLKTFLCLKFPPFPVT